MKQWRQAKKSSLNVLLHDLKLLLGDPEVFPGQMGDIISLVCSVSGSQKDVPRKPQTYSTHSFQLFELLTVCLKMSPIKHVCLPTLHQRDRLFDVTLVNDLNLEKLGLYHSEQPLTST